MGSSRRSGAIATQQSRQPEEWQPVDDNTEMMTQVVDASVLAQITSAELEQQIASAHKYRRSITAFKEELDEMVSSDVETADDCIYSLPRAGGYIEGPSVRFAEMAASAWGNMRYGARPIDTSHRDYVECQGFAHDTQKNVACLIVVRRRVLGRKDEDMRNLAVAAGSSIAKRNAILSVIPRALCKAALERADKVATERGGTMEEQRGKSLAAFRSLGAKDDQVFAALGIEGEADLTGKHIRQLRGMFAAIRGKELTLADALRPAAEREALARSARTNTTPSDIAAGAKPIAASSTETSTTTTDPTTTAGPGDDSQAP